MCAVGVVLGRLDIFVGPENFISPRIGTTPVIQLTGLLERVTTLLVVVAAGGEMRGSENIPVHRPGIIHLQEYVRGRTDVDEQRNFRQ